VTFRQATLDTGHMSALVLGGSQGMMRGSMGCDFQSAALGRIQAGSCVDTDFQAGSVEHHGQQDALTIGARMGCDCCGPGLG